MTPPTYVIRAFTPYRRGAAFEPAWRYFNDRTGWGRYDEATPYPTPTPQPMPVGPRDTSTVDTLEVYPLDLNNGPYDLNAQLGPFRLTECCAAAATYMDRVLTCKSCYLEVDEACGGLARLDGDWVPPTPVIIHLPEPD